MFKDNLKNKIKNMSINGDNNFKIKCDKYIIEFKLFEINNIIFLAISGAAVSLKTYFDDQLKEEKQLDYIMKDIEIDVFKGIDLNIQDSKFI